MSFVSLQYTKKTCQENSEGGLVGFRFVYKMWGLILPEKLLELIGVQNGSLSGGMKAVGNSLFTLYRYVVFFPSPSVADEDVGVWMSLLKAPHPSRYHKRFERFQYTSSSSHNFLKQNWWRISLTWCFGDYFLLFLIYFFHQGKIQIWVS